MSEFLGRLPLVAVALLMVNDHVLKVRWPGFVTGKLSDIAGCFLLPLFVSGLLALTTRWSLGPRLALGASATAVLFAAIKLSPVAADGVAALLSAMGRPVGAPDSRIVADVTDLAALPFVGLAVWYGSWAGTGEGWRRGRRLGFAGKVALLTVTFLVLAATSLAATCPPESGLVDGPVRLWSDTDCGPSGYVVLRVDPRTCRASLEGGEAVGLADHGTVHWSHDRSIALQSEAPLGLAVPEGYFPMTGCTLSLQGLGVLRVDCRSWTSERRLMGPFHELRRCSGTLRPAAAPEQPTDPRDPPSS